MSPYTTQKLELVHMGTETVPEVAVVADFTLEISLSDETGTGISESLPLEVPVFDRRRSRPTLEQIVRVQGKYRNVLSPTDEFLARKRRELELEDGQR